MLVDIEIKENKQIYLNEVFDKINLESVNEICDKLQRDYDGLRKYTYHFDGDETIQERYDRMIEKSIQLLPKGFEGISFRSANFWFEHIPLTNIPIKYLEIGVLYGANALGVAETYGKVVESEIHCVDPWVEYKEDNDDIAYDNIKDIYNVFLRNISISEHKDKFRIYKNYSHKIVPTFEDNTFDIIYVDGNHGQINVLEDGIMTFRKLKIGGYLIFDDVDWRNTTNALLVFLEIYKEYIDILALDNLQLFIKKIKDLE